MSQPLGKYNEKGAIFIIQIIKKIIFIVLLDVLLTVLNVLNKLALIPGGGSNTNIRPALNKLTGSLGLISIVRNNLKLAWGCNECNFFSSCTNHWGAKCTFLSITHLKICKMYIERSLHPDIFSFLISFFVEVPLNLTYFHKTKSRYYLPVLQAMLIALSAWLKPSADPMAMLEICLLSSAARSSTRPDASNPGTEHRRAGTCDL